MTRSLSDNTSSSLEVVKPEGDSEGFQDNEHPLAPHDALKVLNSADRELGSHEVTDTLAVKFLSGLSGDDTERSVNEIAKALQMDTEKAEQMVGNVYESFYNQTAKHIEKASGLDGHEVLEVISKVLTPSERSSMMHRVYLGDKSVIHDIITKYR